VSPPTDTTPLRPGESCEQGERAGRAVGAAEQRHVGGVPGHRHGECERRKGQQRHARPRENHAHTETRLRGSVREGRELELGNPAGKNCEDLFESFCHCAHASDIGPAAGSAHGTRYLFLRGPSYLLSGRKVLRLGVPEGDPGLGRSASETRGRRSTILGGGHRKHGKGRGMGSDPLRAR